MRVPYLRDFPAKLISFFEHWFSGRRIDDHDFAAGIFAHQPDIIIRQNGDPDDFDAHLPMARIGH